MDNTDRIGMAFQAGRISLSEAYWELIQMGLTQSAVFETLTSWNKEKEKHMELTAAEYHYLKTLVLLKQESQESDKVRNIDLTLLYGKLNVLWSEARKAERAIA